MLLQQMRRASSAATASDCDWTSTYATQIYTPVRKGFKKKNAKITIDFENIASLTKSKNSACTMFD
jgi:hypothetical protein